MEGLGLCGSAFMALGGGQGGIGLFITPRVRGNWTRFVAIDGTVSMVAGWLLRLSIALYTLRGSSGRATSVPDGG